MREACFLFAKAAVKPPVSAAWSSILHQLAVGHDIAVDLDVRKIGLPGKNSRGSFDDIRVVGRQGKIGVELFFGHRDHAAFFGRIHHLILGNRLNLNKICARWSFPYLLVYIIRSRIEMSTNEVCEISTVFTACP